MGVENESLIIGGQSIGMTLEELINSAEASSLSEEDEGWAEAHDSVLKAQILLVRYCLEKDDGTVKFFLGSLINNPRYSLPILLSNISPEEHQQLLALDNSARDSVIGVYGDERVAGMLYDLAFSAEFKAGNFYNKLYRRNLDRFFQLLPHHPALVSLDLSHNFLKSVGTLPQFLRETKTLKVLNISLNRNISDVKHLAEALAINTTLIELDVGMNNFNAQVVEHFALALQKNQTLQVLEYSGNNAFNDDGATALSAALALNDTLISLNIRHNHISATGARRLVETLKTNYALTEFKYDDESAAFSPHKIEITGYLERNKRLKPVIDIQKKMVRPLLSMTLLEFEQTLLDLEKKTAFCEQLLQMDFMLYPHMNPRNRSEWSRDSGAPSLSPEDIACVNTSSLHQCVGVYRQFLLAKAIGQVDSDEEQSYELDDVLPLLKNLSQQPSMQAFYKNCLMHIYNDLVSSVNVPKQDETLTEEEMADNKYFRSRALEVASLLPETDDQRLTLMRKMERPLDTFRRLALSSTSPSDEMCNLAKVIFKSFAGDAPISDSYTKRLANLIKAVPRVDEETIHSLAKSEHYNDASIEFIADALNFYSPDVEKPATDDIKQFIAALIEYPFSNDDIESVLKVANEYFKNPQGNMQHWFNTSHEISSHSLSRVIILKLLSRGFLAGSDETVNYSLVVEQENQPKLPESVTEQSSDSLLQKCEKFYLRKTCQLVAKTEPSTRATDGKVLFLARELGLVVNPDQPGGAILSAEIRNIISQTLQNYKSSWFLNSQRKTAVKDLQSLINAPNNTYIALLTALMAEKQKIRGVDVKHYKISYFNLHRDGRSRYYETVSEIIQQVFRECMRKYPQEMQHALALFETDAKNIFANILSNVEQWKVKNKGSEKTVIYIFLDGLKDVTDIPKIIQSCDMFKSYSTNRLIPGEIKALFADLQGTADCLRPAFANTNGNSCSPACF